VTAPTDNTTQQRRPPPVVAAAPLLAPTPGVGLVGHAQALQSILSDVSTLTISQLVQLFRQYGAQPGFPAVLREAFPEIVRPHAQAAAQITAQWFDELHPLSARQAEPVVDLPADRIGGTIDWALNAPTKARVVEAPAPPEIPHLHQQKCRSKRLRRQKYRPNLRTLSPIRRRSLIDCQDRLSGWCSTHPGPPFTRTATPQRSSRGMPRRTRALFVRSWQPAAPSITVIGLRPAWWGVTDTHAGRSRSAGVTTITAGA
jgi:hypothetical protein